MLNKTVLACCLAGMDESYEPMSAVAAVWVTTDWTQNAVSHALSELSKNVA